MQSVFQIFKSVSRRSIHGIEPLNSRSSVRTTVLIPSPSSIKLMPFMQTPPLSAIVKACTDSEGNDLDVPIVSSAELLAIMERRFERIDKEKTSG